MRYAIYIPGDGTANDQKLVDVGLGQFKVNAAFIETGDGPDGKRGVVISWPDRYDPRSTMPYLPDHQTWFPAAARDGMPAGRFWIGFDKLSPLTPDNCATGQFKGYNTVLGDGQTYVIPAAAQFPSDITIGDHGQPIYAIQERYQGLLIESSQWAHFLESIDQNQTGTTIDGAVVDYLARMLQLNYGRLIPDVIEHLGLFTPNAIFRALLAATAGMISSETEGAASNV